MVADIGANTFPAQLRVALHASGLTLETVQRRLADRGFTLARSTLSYWQNGRRLPSAATSLLAVAALEDILKVPTGTFVGALTATAPPPAVSDLEMSGVASRIDALMEAVGCPDGFSGMEPLATIDVIDGGPTGGLRTARSIETFRAASDIEHYPLLYGGEAGGDPELIRHELVSGGRIGRVRRDTSANVVVSEAVFDRYVRRGEHHVLHYITHDENPAPCELFYRLVLTPRSMVVIDLGFHPDCLPVRLEEFERAVDTGPDLFVRQRTLSPDRRVTVVRERARRGVVGLRWEYA